MDSAQQIIYQIDQAVDRNIGDLEYFTQTEIGKVTEDMERDIMVIRDNGRERIDRINASKDDQIRVLRDNAQREKETLTAQVARQLEDQARAEAADVRQLAA